MCQPFAFLHHTVAELVSFSHVCVGNQVAVVSVIKLKFAGNISAAPLLECVCLRARPRINAFVRIYLPRGLTVI